MMSAIGVVVDLRNRLREERRADDTTRADGRQKAMWRFMMASYRPADVRAGCGRSMIFCTRHAVISAT